MAQYFKTWWTIIFQPIYFYAKLKEESWQDDSLTFLLSTSWILGFVATLIVFVIQYVPIGGTLVEGIAGFKFILILPVLFALAFVFFLITFLILGGAFTCAFFVLFYSTATTLNQIYSLLGGKGSLNRMIQSVFYSSAVSLVALLILFLMVLTRYAGMDFMLFRYGYNFLYFSMLLYIYGLLAVAGRLNYKISKAKSFLGAIAPIIVLLIFGLIFDKIALPKLQSWIT